MDKIKKIRITADCVCDLPAEYLRSLEVNAICFYIYTDTGRFRDGDEITSANLLEYLESGGKKALTMAPSVEEYTSFFKENLRGCDEIIHICISSCISLSYQNSSLAASELSKDGKKVHIINSKHLSTGMGHLIIKAVSMQRDGASSDEIIAELNDMIPRISTTFITVNADYLYRNGRVSKPVKNVCSALDIHPVLYMKDGAIKLKNVRFGNYRKAYIRYINSELRNAAKIDRQRIFITHAGCTAKDIGIIKDCVNKKCSFDDVMVTKASATISSNCGTGTFGVLFLRNS